MLEIGVHPHRYPPLSPLTLLYEPWLKWKSPVSPVCCATSQLHPAHLHRGMAGCWWGNIQTHRQSGWGGGGGREEAFGERGGRGRGARTGGAGSILRCSSVPEASCQSVVGSKQLTCENTSCFIACQPRGETCKKGATSYLKLSPHPRQVQMTAASIGGGLQGCGRGVMSC